MAAMLTGGAVFLAVMPAQAARPGLRQAWFYAKDKGAQWCAYTDHKKADAAANSGRYDGSQAAYLRYRGGAIESILVTMQSEDARVEDRYLFTADLRVKSVTRRGNYVSDPPLVVTYLPDANGTLRMTAASLREAERVRRAKRRVYFLDWWLYDAFRKLPFAGLIATGRSIAVTPRCAVAAKR